jgi:hypothetical protein
MTRHEITLDIYSHWGDKPPVYRIYVDNDLLTERTFNYPGNKNYIKEHVVVDLNPGRHYIEVIKIGTDNATSTLTEKSIFLDGEPLQSTVVGSKHEFTISE